jgi:acyl-CoA thioester hydrolase
MARLVCNSDLRVRYSETDQMGFVYHSHYLVWCEVGRTDFMRELGMSYADIERQGFRLAVADAQLRYHLAARYDDLIRVRTSIDRVQSRAVTFAYEILRAGPGTPQRLASANTKLICLDTGGTLRSLPPALLDRFRDACASPSD